MLDQALSVRANRDVGKVPSIACGTHSDARRLDATVTISPLMWNPCACWQ